VKCRIAVPKSSHQRTNAGQSVGSAMDDDEGNRSGLEVDDDQQINQHDGRGETDEQR